MIVSDTVFLWFCSIMVFGLAVIWGIWDGRLLLKLWNEGEDRHDERFGAMMGLVIMVIGVTGVVLHHLSR